MNQRRHNTSVVLLTNYTIVPSSGASRLVDCPEERGETELLPYAQIKYYMEIIVSPGRTKRQSLENIFAFIRQKGEGTPQTSLRHLHLRTLFKSMNTNHALKEGVRHRNIHLKQKGRRLTR